MQTISTQHERHPTEDADYEAVLRHHREVTAWPLFTTTAGEGLFDIFLAALPADRRQHYDCRACRRFVDHFGGLVTIGASGAAFSPFWDDWAPTFFGEAFRALSRAVSKARVTGVFLSSEPVWGLPSNTSAKAAEGAWHHMHLRPAANMVHRPSTISTTSAVIAEKREEFGMLCRGLADYPIAAVRQAFTLLTTGHLYRSEKCIGVAKWILDLHEAREKTTHAWRRENVTWLAVASAPPGFCHVRTTMISTLLDDIVAGKDFASIKRAFDAKMAPTQYQRPQAAPTDGQLAAAETVVSKLASAGSLERRFATLADVWAHAVWSPKPVPPAAPAGGVFGHLKTAAAKAPEIEVPPQIMTWEKFARTVLLDAERIEMLVPRTRTPFFAFVTAANMDAPPILQWDREDARNPVSWYFYLGGSTADAWNLTAGSWCDVDALTMQPSGWTGKLEHQGDGVFAVLRGAKDMCGGAGLALFPETLKSDYHGIRAAIEAYSNSKALPKAETHACGIALQKSGSGRWTETFRVTSKGTTLLYKLDRWD